MAELKLELGRLEPKDTALPDVTAFAPSDVQRDLWDWDRVVKGSHLTNCWYQQACNYNLYVKDGVILREEQAPIIRRKTIPRRRISIPAVAKKDPATRTGFTIRPVSSF